MEHKGNAYTKVRIEQLQRIVCELLAENHRLRGTLEGLRVTYDVFGYTCETCDSGERPEILKSKETLAVECKCEDLYRRNAPIR